MEWSQEKVEGFSIRRGKPFCIFFGFVKGGGEKETRRWHGPKRLQQAKGSFHQQKGKKEEKTILVGHRRGGAEGQRVNSACNMQHIFVG